MLKKISGIIYALSLSLLLSNCSAAQLNTVNNIVKDLKAGKGATINISNVDSKDINEVQVDGKKLSTKDYSLSDNKLNLPNLEPGKHVVEFNHKKYGSTDVPIEVRQNNENNYQLNPNIANDKINDWELGIDSNKDGIIDNNSFVSRQVENYVVVREFSGTTNYLPKQNFSQDYRGQKVYPKPDNFNFPGFNENQPGFPNNTRREPKPVFLTKDPNVQGQPGHIMNNQPNPNMGEPRQDIFSPIKVNVPFPRKLATYKIIGVFIGEQLLPENTYMKQQDSLIFRGEVLKGKNNIMKVYLIDETGQGVLLSINPKRPIFNIDNKNPQNKLNQEIFVGSQDLDYSLQKNIKLDIQKIEQLKRNNQSGNKIPPNDLPFQPGHQENMSPNGKLIPVPFGKTQGNVNMPPGDTNKYVKIDENGEITDYVDNVPPEHEQDISLKDDRINQIDSFNSTKK